MQVTIHSTSKVVEVVVDGVNVPARVWEGTTANGVPVAALVTRITCDRDADQAEFRRDLAETHPPGRIGAEAFPARMVL